MQTYEYVVVTSDNKIQRVIADSIEGVLEAVDEEETPIVNIFRNVEITQGGVSKEAVIRAVVVPQTAFETGCRAYPSLPVSSAQGKQIVLSATIMPGWRFEGWYLGDTKVAEELQAVLINQAAGEAVYEARYTPFA